MQIDWFTSVDGAMQRFDELRGRAQVAQDTAYREKKMRGWCPSCRRETNMHLVETPDGGWTNLREALFCECGLNSRMRMIMGVFEKYPPSGRFLMFERVTPLFGRMQERYPFVEGCEYFGDDVPPGEIRQAHGINVRHENMLNLSYSDRTFRYVFHGDVLEHVPDMQVALRECHRVLEPGGTLLFTCPVFNFRKHNVRAVVENGALKHILEPAYHGNPMDPNGALVFAEPGLELLDDLRRAGFATAELGLAFNPEQGILRDGNPYDDYNMWPIIFKATRAS